MELVMALPEYSKVYSDNKEMVWRLISRYVTSHSDKEDLFQEIMLNIHRALKGFRGESALETWIYRISVNTAISFLKKQERHKKLVEVLKRFSFAEAAGEPNVGEEDKVLLPLEKLNAQQRMILLMSDVEEKKIEEIASVLKLPVGTVKSNLFRAREILRKEVEKNG
jgi:RNA polymerase sigma-70 factor (ECF subfamily)